MKPLGGLAVAVLLSLCVTACGGSGKSTNSSPNIVVPSDPTAQVNTTSFKGDIDDEEEHSSGSSVGDTDADEDNDVKEHDYYQDRDDALIAAYGHAAGAADYRAITTFVKRYYAVAAAGNGAEACSMIAPAFAKRIPQEFGSTDGPAYMRGNTCAVVMSRLFKYDHQKLTSVSEVTGVRVKGKEALVLLGSKTWPASYLELERQAGGWRVVDLLATPLP